jgi:hypothetical protein
MSQHREPRARDAVQLLLFEWGFERVFERRRTLPNRISAAPIASAQRA